MSTRSKLIRLASTMPSGSMERKTLLAILADKDLPISKSAASAKAIGKYRKLEDHLKSKGDQEGLTLLDEFATAMGI